MLQELSIDNFAIIPHLQIDFNNTMTVLSGETGAGKSIIIDAVGLLCGGRGSQDFIRNGSGKAVLQAIFLIDLNNQQLIKLLTGLGIEVLDDQLIIQRELQRNGRNIIRVNGILLNLTNLKKIGDFLVDIHGQNEHQELMQPERHLKMLDQYAEDETTLLKKEYTSVFLDYKSVLKAVNEKEKNQQEWAQRFDMLKFQVDELNEAQLIENEEEQLLVEKTRLNNFQKIQQALEKTANYLEGTQDIGIVDNVGKAMQEMQSIEDIDESYQEISETITSSFYSLQELTKDINRQIDFLEYDEQRLNEIEQRLDLIHQLERKYGNNVNEMLSYLDKITKEFSSMEKLSGNADQLEEKLTRLTEKLTNLAKKLTKIRKQKALELTDKIHQQLKELFMDKAKFSVVFNEKNNFQADGIDDVEFYIQTNPGEDSKPLAKIASGGELSRMMLAMKTIFVENQNIGTIIFDEIDTGVSGRVAQAIAEKMAKISMHAQVLTITHLPQVAAMADYHYLIQKNVIKDRTTTNVTLLDDDKRAHELARMLSGVEVTKLSLANANELLKLATTKKEVKHE